MAPPIDRPTFVSNLEIRMVQLLGCRTATSTPFSAGKIAAPPGTSEWIKKPAGTPVPKSRFRIGMRVKLVTI